MEPGMREGTFFILASIVFIISSVLSFFILRWVLTWVIGILGLTLTWVELLLILIALRILVKFVLG